VEHSPEQPATAAAGGGTLCLTLVVESGHHDGAGTAGLAGVRHHWGGLDPARPQEETAHRIRPRLDGGPNSERTWLRRSPSEPCERSSSWLYMRRPEGRSTMFLFKKSLEMPAPGKALPGRPRALPTASHHFVNGHPLKRPYPSGLATALFGMGCFWGAERKFWELGEGVYATVVGYTAGQTPNPTYEE